MADMVQPDRIAVPFEWNFPQSVQSRYANNILVQHSEHESIVSFFEVIPPILLGEPQQVSEQLKQIKSIRGNCVARIIVATEKMPEFIKVLQDNLRQFHSSSAREDVTNR